MQTTIRMDDDLFRTVKAAAAEAGITLTAFIEEAVRARLARHAASPDQDVDLTVYNGDGLQPGVDLDDTATLLDLMETD